MWSGGLPHPPIAVRLSPGGGSVDPGFDHAKLLCSIGKRVGFSGTILLYDYAILLCGAVRLRYAITNARVYNKC